MDYETVRTETAKHMKNILGFAVSRLDNKSEAEDLAGDILCNVLQSAHRLKDDSRFYAFLWAVADNTYRNYLRQMKRVKTAPLFENLAENEPDAPDALILREDLARLRRELALLSECHRQVTVLYYYEGLSCAEIAEKMCISTDMVKYYLFCARKKLREGLMMERTWGEKSYRPIAFEIDFWGTKAGDDEEYRAFQRRKLPSDSLCRATSCSRPITAQLPCKS